MPRGPQVGVLLAVVIWPARQDQARDPAPGASVATTGPLGPVAPRVAWALLWAGLGYLILQPASRAAGSVSAMLTGMKDGEPGWIASLDSGLARGLAGHGTVVAIALAILCTAAVLGIAAPSQLARRAGRGPGGPGHLGPPGLRRDFHRPGHRSQFRAAARGHRRCLLAPHHRTWHRAS